MRRILYGLAIFLAGMSMATAQMLPSGGNAVMQPDVSANVHGAVNIDQNGQLWFVQFDVFTQTEWGTGVQSTVFQYSFYTEPPGVEFRSGFLSCDVPNNSVNASQSRGSINIRISDPTESCSGFIYEEGVPVQSWTQPVEVTGYMASPERSYILVGMQTETDNLTGLVDRYQCQSAWGYEATSGGFSLTLPDFEGFLYFPVVSDPEAYNVITGGFMNQNCRRVTKTK